MTRGEGWRPSGRTAESVLRMRVGSALVGLLVVAMAVAGAAVLVIGNAAAGKPAPSPFTDVCASALTTTDVIVPGATGWVVFTCGGSAAFHSSAATGKVALSVNTTTNQPWTALSLVTSSFTPDRTQTSCAAAFAGDLNRVALGRVPSGAHSVSDRAASNVYCADYRAPTNLGPRPASITAKWTKWGAFTLQPPAESSPPPPPPPTGGFTFGIVGDFNYNPNFMAVVNLTAANNPNFFLAAGDLAYNDVDEATWCNYFKSRYNNVEFIAGNHEMVGTVGERFSEYLKYCPYTLDEPLTGSYGAEYFFDYPAAQPLARFILTGCGLDWSLYGSGFWACQAGDAHYNFVKTAIEDGHARGIPWTIVVLHIPLVDIGNHTTTASEDLQDLMFSEHVDLIVSGHMHNYERSQQLTCMPLDWDLSCIVDPSTPFVKGAGTVDAIVGMGGSNWWPLYQFTPFPQTCPYAYWEVCNHNKWYDSGYLSVNLTANRLTATYLLAVPSCCGGAPFTDTFQIGA